MEIFGKLTEEKKSLLSGAIEGPKDAGFFADRERKEGAEESEMEEPDESEEDDMGF